jgi:adenosylcobinamide-phosphate synthase
VPAALRPGRASASWPVAAGLAAGVAADLLLADPRRGHPVAGFGAVAAAAERAVHRDSRLAGTAYAVVLTGAAAALGRAVERSLPGSLPTAGATALATWAVVGGTSLRREAHEMSRLLEAGDLDAARSGSATCAGATPPGSTRQGSRGRPSSPSPRTPPTPSSDRSCGAPSAGCRACSPTGR